MPRPAEIIAAIVRNGGYLEVAGDRLVYRSHPDAIPLTDELCALIRDHRDELVSWLKTPAADLPAEDLEALDFAPDCKFLVGQSAASPVEERRGITLRALEGAAP